MFVRFLGISLEPKAAVSLEDLFRYLSTKRDEQIEVGNINRLAIVDQETDDKYYFGVIVTIKDQRRFCELAKEQGKMCIKVINLEDHQSIMEFNFFAINKSTGLGLYQHYHQSCSIGQFAYLLSKRYREIADILMQAEIKQSQNIDEKTEKAIKRRFAGKLEWSILHRKEGLEALLLELDKINSFEFDFIHLASIEPEYTPLSGKIRKERKTFSFIKNTFAQHVAHEIAKLANTLNITNGRVSGEDSEGIDRIIRIMDNPDNYGEYLYDDVAAKLNNLDLAAISDSWVLKELRHKAQEYKHIFEAKIE